MLEHLQNVDGAGEGLSTLTNLDHPPKFYNVCDFIADLWSGKLGEVGSMTVTPPAPQITAEAAYRLGVIDGRNGLEDYSQHATPFQADYVRGYAVGQGKVAERLPLSTPVKLRNGVEAVVSGHSTASCTSYRVSWYDRVHLVVRHKWTERGAFEVIGNTNKTAIAA